ncbi:MAG: prepilin peptidase [Coriobacteriia bacterium]|nr:prepilin peptidase [Coriobacteriia bacterium]
MVVPPWYFALAMGVFGLLFGSFANVVIWRVPRGESISRPGSHCPGCQAPIAWHDNIPILSWLLLRGRCRHCGEPIAVRYPLVEAASGALFLIAALAWGPGLRAAFAAAFFWFLLVLSAIDLDTMRLPNPIVGAMAVVGGLGVVIATLSGSVAVPLHDGPSAGLLAHPVAFAVTGVLLGMGVSGGVAAAYGTVRGKSGLGMGDVKLLGAMGIYLGPYVLLALLAGSLLGVAGGLFAARGSSLSETRIPFGPWLALGAALSALAGDWLFLSYLRLIGLT